MDTASFAKRWESRTARFTAHWGRSGTVVTVDGELDAANADECCEYVRRRATDGEWLVLDFTGLDFIGTAGFAALHRINTWCAGREMRWTMVPSPAVSRLLRICDPDAVLPSAESIATALVTVHEPAQLLQLVAQSG